MSEEQALPCGWVRAHLGNLGEVRLGRQRSPKNRSDKFPTPYLRAANITWKGLDLSDVLEMDFRPEERETYKLQPGDLLLSEASGSIDEAGKPALWQGEIDGCCFQNTVIRFRSEVMHPRYMLGLFSHCARNKLFAEVAHGLGIHHIGAERLARVEVPVPPLNEQRRIADKLDELLSQLDAGVAALARVQANLKRYRAAVLKAAVEGRLTAQWRAEHPEVEPASVLPAATEARSKSKRRAGRLWGAGVVPELTFEERAQKPPEWIWCKVRDLGPVPDDVVQVGPMSMRSRDFEACGTPVLNVGCVQWDFIDESKLNHLPDSKANNFNRYRIAAGDVLFTRSGTVGRCAVATERHDGWLMTFHLLRVRVEAKRCLPDFLRVVFEGAPHIRRQTVAGAVGATRAGFNTSLLAGLDLALPSVAEQEQILLEVDRLLSMAGEADRAVKAGQVRAARLRQSILKQAFEGKLVPQDPNDEPAEVLLQRIAAERGQARPKARRPRQRP